MAILRPLDLKMQPAPYDARMKVISRTLELLDKYKPQKTDSKTTAVHWEYEVARHSASKQSYIFNASLLLRDIVRYKGNLNKSGKYESPKVQISKESVLAKLKELLLDEKQLKEGGYILGPGVGGENNASSKSDNGLRECARCSQKFEELNIMVPTSCQFHPSRQQYNKGTRSYHYPCCGEDGVSVTPYSLGCKTLEQHVYRQETYEDMSKTIEFRHTKDFVGDSNVLGLDCEMAYTSYGYELIRLTVVDFWTKKALFDEIVQPLGEIIDLNSQFSGVHEIDRATSLTFEDARKIFLGPKMINTNSILIGHGLENDLNILRIIHDKIIDTAILYPNGKFKSSLKNLAFQELSRKIQTGEHDSSEDAIASMDIIKSKLGIPLDRDIW
ncbi:HBR050Wp [Eremothecium sinecaudum]|uniref:RNA exonuclease 3 n=1 Tax=Eremothecium sinecaudum TaxID=45286 RepID=A0A125RDY9_9SACH|nr:HBR050Wp [Eremothecium sinecaudum]AMD18951.1 HBR050Wp [Eremothecium sinecaudum]